MTRKGTLALIVAIGVLMFYTGCDGDDNGNGLPGAVAPEASEATAAVPQTGQTTCWDSGGTVIACAGTGQDGDIQAGVVPPNPRFTENGDGTITDNLTGLIWLRNANCLGSTGTWQQALDFANGLADGQCNLMDGSMAGDWYLPNRNQLMSLLDLEHFNPALPDGQPFENLQSSLYWSSTSVTLFPGGAWVVGFGSGSVHDGAKTVLHNFVTAVRGGS